MTMQPKKDLRSFTKQQLKQWVIADRLGPQNQTKIDAIIQNALRPMSVQSPKSFWRGLQKKI